MNNTYQRNHNHTKNHCIFTPLPLSMWLKNNLILPCGKLSLGSCVFDPCCGNGRLLLPWADEHTCIGMDTKKYPPICDFQFYQDDFLTTSRVADLKPDLLLVNPPYNYGAGNGRARTMLPELFLRRIVSLYGRSVPLVFFAPIGFRFNQKVRSKRWQWLRDYGPRLCKSIPLPIDVFPGVLFHSEILFYNCSVESDYLPDFVVH